MNSFSGHSKGKKNYKEVIGLLPAGGQASRISPLPFSKELYPIGFRRLKKDGSVRPKVVCHYLLEKMRLAGIKKTFIVLRNGKWDIPAYFGDGSIVNMHLSYLMLGLPLGTPYTIDQAYPFIQEAIVAFGFPDILFKPDEAFVQLLKWQNNTNADIILGLFPVDQPRKWDMVHVGKDGRIKQILVKPQRTNLRYAWIIAVWTPAFTHFMHQYLAANTYTDKQGKVVSKVSRDRELFIGEVIQAAIENDFRVEGVLFPENMCLDIGTPDDLEKVFQNKYISLTQKIRGRYDNGYDQ